MQRTQYILLGVTVGAAIIASTVAQGFITERFNDHNTNEYLQVMAKRLDNVPLRFGDWTGTVLVDPPDLIHTYKEVARVTGWKNLSYRNGINGREVKVSLVCGHNRHVGIHTPDQCMLGAGFNYAPGEHAREDEVKYAAHTAQLRTAQFIRETSTSTENQRIAWTFSCDGEWIAPDTGRAGLVDKSGWYKLYVTTTAAGTQAINTDASKEFLMAFLPRLNDVLFPPEHNGAGKGHETAAR